MLTLYYCCLCRCQSPGVDKTKPKRNLFDNASNLLTNLLAGGNLKNMPVAERAVTDLFDRPLFYSLYDWFIEVLVLLCLVLLTSFSAVICSSYWKHALVALCEH